MPVELRHLVELITVMASTFVAGLGASLHCAVMCGPLACAQPNRSAWHVGRLVGYATVGAAFGAFGQGLTFAAPVRAALPWVMAAGLVATALDVGRRLPAIPILKPLVSRIGRFPATKRSFVVGALTPLLPCGLLFGLFFTAIGTGSAVGGASAMVSFGFGAVPALLGLGAGLTWLGRWPSLRWALRTGLPLAAAVVLVLRALFTPPEAACGQAETSAFLDHGEGTSRVGPLSWRAPTSIQRPSTASSQER